MKFADDYSVFLDKMKFTLIILALVGLASAGLREDIDRLRDLVPVAKIKTIVKSYVDRGDAELLELHEYIRSDKFRTLRKKVWEIPEVRKGFAGLEAAGVNVKELLNDIAAVIGLPSLPEGKQSNIVAYGFKDLAKEIRAILPLNDIIVTALELLQTSPEFQELYKKVRSPESRNVLTKIATFPETKDLVKKLREHGLNVDKIVKAVKDFLEWN